MVHVEGEEKEARPSKCQCLINLYSTIVSSECTTSSISCLAVITVSVTTVRYLLCLLTQKLDFDRVAEEIRPRGREA